MAQSQRRESSLMMLAPLAVFLPHASQAVASIHHSTLQIAQVIAQNGHHSTFQNWLTHLGRFGFFAVAIVDSSVIPLPVPGSTDLLLLWLIAHSGSPWLLVPIAVLGSLVGGYTTWQIGHKGGEAALRRYVPVRLLGRVVGWVEHHPVLAVFLPAVLPPPIPLSPFVLASGALGVSRGRFLAAFGAARILRYSLIAWLGVAYGRHVIRLWTGTLQKWSTPLLCVFAALLIGGIWMAISKARRLRKSDAAEKPALQAKAAQTD